MALFSVINPARINQFNEKEKMSQVMKMAQLYSSAGQVCIWLGPADNHGRTDRAMNFVREIVKEHDVEKPITPQIYDTSQDLPAEVRLGEDLAISCITFANNTRRPSMVGGKHYKWDGAPPSTTKAHDE